MKILITELFPEKGHRRLLDNIVRLLKDDYDIYVAIPKNSGNNFDTANIVEMKDTYYYDKESSSRNKFNYYQYNLSRIIELNGFVKMINPDYVFIVTYTEVPLGIFSFLYKEWNKTILMNHNNIDCVLTNKIKRFLFDRFARKVKHIALCDFIADKMSQDLAISRKNIAVWPHPLYQNSIDERSIEKKYDCVGISNSNDESIIKRIIEKEKKSAYLKKNNLRVVLRSKEIEYDNGYLKVLVGSLPKEEYDSYINSTRSIFLAFPPTFQYRMSGTLMDALSNRIPVIGTNIPLVTSYYNKYKNVLRIYSDDNFVDDIKAVSEINEAMQRDFDAFLNEHSDVELQRCMINTFSALILKEDFRS